MSFVMRQGWPIISAVVMGLLLLLAIQLLLLVKDSTPSRDVHKMKSSFLRKSSPSHSLEEPNGSVKCDRCDERYDICFINGPTLLDPSKSTIFPMGETSGAMTLVKPYPKKDDVNAMSAVKTITIASTPPRELCGVTHQSPALLLSTGGHIGNFFHDFNDDLIPLFITVNSFLAHRDFILVVADFKTWWTKKYSDLLSHLSSHPIINMDNTSTTHCFPSMIVGLISHGFMTINPHLIHPSKSFLDFQNFLKNAYSKRENTMSLLPGPSAKPRLILMERKGKVGRVILNQDEVVKAAIHSGFEVCVYDPTQESSLADAFSLIQRSHAMLGLHGAGLTHSLFLRPGSVLIQVVPIGFDWVAKICFENSARALGLEYMEYRISLNESSLREKYGPDSLVIRDPMAYVIGNMDRMYIYLHTNVTLDMVKVKSYLKESYQKAKILMNKDG